MRYRTDAKFVGRHAGRLAGTNNPDLTQTVAADSKSNAEREANGKILHTRVHKQSTILP